MERGYRLIDGFERTRVVAGTKRHEDFLAAFDALAAARGNSSRRRTRGRL